MSSATFNSKTVGRSRNPKRLRSQKARDAFQDMTDAALIEDCAEFCHLFQDYVIGCRILEEIESGMVHDRNIEEVHCQLASAGRQWRAALKRLATSPAFTDTGRFAKGRAIQSYFLEFRAQSEIMDVMYSLLKDLENSPPGL